VAEYNQHNEIVKLCIQGERTAQFELYNLYNKAMFNLCLRILKTREDAEDVLQSSFVDVFGKIETFRFESTIGSWIKRIVVNNCINEIRKRKMNFVDIDKNQIENLGSVEIDAVNLNVDKLNEAIQSLSDGYRVVFTLYALEGYDHEEIGQILNINESTSKSQYSRAKQRLRDYLVHPSKLIVDS
jgi:RNA polymerase sigma factor (sigma-70 family)